MKFGQHQYQHRFYHPRSKKLSLQSNETLLQSRHSYQSPPLLITNQNNLKVRGGQISRKDLGWQAYKIKEQIVDRYAGDYFESAEVLQKFRREADQFRRNKLRKVITQQRPLLKTSQAQDDMQLLRDEKEEHRKPHIQQENPEKTIDKYDVGIMTKLDYAQMQNQIMKRLREEELERRRRHKAKSYLKKYQQLKRQLQGKIIELREIQEYTIQRQERDLKQHEAKTYEHLQRMLKDISIKIRENSSLLANSMNKIAFQNQSELKYQQTIDNSTIANQQTIKFPPIPKGVSLSGSPMPLPKISYSDRKVIDQFNQLCSAQEEIKERKRRLKTYGQYQTGIGYGIDYIW